MRGLAGKGIRRIRNGYSYRLMRRGNRKRRAFYIIVLPVLSYRTTLIASFSFWTTASGNGA
jgi:hypothetical protein